MNERRLSYVYSFKCEDELEHFENLSDKVQGNTEAMIAKFRQEADDEKRIISIC
jgi:hypothetical protein